MCIQRIIACSPYYTYIYIVIYIYTNIFTLIAYPYPIAMTREECVVGCMWLPQSFFSSSLHCRHAGTYVRTVSVLRHMIRSGAPQMGTTYIYSLLSLHSLLFHSDFSHTDVDRLILLNNHCWFRISHSLFLFVCLFVWLDGWLVGWFDGLLVGLLVGCSQCPLCAGDGTRQLCTFRTPVSIWLVT